MQVADFLIGFSFDHEDGEVMFLRNVGWVSMDYMALYPENRTLLYYFKRVFKPIHYNLQANTET
jgi:hypothetical protein